MAVAPFHGEPGSRVKDRKIPVGVLKKEANQR
jgi:hypothetical protein